MGSSVERTLDATDTGVGPHKDIRSPFLFLILEAARTRAGGRRVSLGSVDEAVLGRSLAEREVERRVERGTRTLRFRIPDRRASTCHARLTRVAHDVFRIEDTDSRNGTRVNGEPLREPRLLTDGDILEIGYSFFRFRASVTAEIAESGDLDLAPTTVESAAIATLLPPLAKRVRATTRLAASALSIVLLGETGTGKEVIARTVHAHSKRKGPFIAVNCGALPQALVESQLFGHVRGAFTGAAHDAPGLFRAAEGGTLLLDEIGDLPKQAQAALLRVLQEREVMPVGGHTAIPIDVRVIAATHHDLRDLVARGEFRRDLFARLSGLVVELPSLRDRVEDLGVFAAAATRSGEALSADAARALIAYDWPMNVRELRQTLERARILAGGERIEVQHLPAEIAMASLSDAATRQRGLEETAAHAVDAETEALRRALVEQLALHEGNVSSVAKAMGKARMQVQRWLKRFGLDPAVFRR